MLLADKISSRIFTNHGDYFDVDDKNLRTRIIITKCCISGDVGMQLARFRRRDGTSQWEFAGNPYCGVYLSPAEWQQVIAAMIRKGGKPTIQQAEREIVKDSNNGKN